MPVEDIQVPKAPRDWRPSPDQQRQVQSDPRLSRMGRDDLYFYFNKPKKKSSAPRPQPRSSGGLGGVFDTVTRALRGD